MPALRGVLGATLAVVVFLFWTGTGAWATLPQVVVVLSREIRPYVLAAQGLENALGRPVVRLYVEDGPSALYPAMTELERGGAVFVAVGDEALEMVSRLDPTPPTTALMVLNLSPWPASARSALSAVLLQIPLEEQLVRIAALLPRIKTLGVPMSTAGARDVFSSALAALKSAVPFTLRPLLLQDPSGWSSLLAATPAPAEALLFIPDPALGTVSLIRYVTAQCLLRNIIPIGYNRAFHEAGAAMSFIVDYEGVGREGARLVEAMARGRTGTVLPPPYRVWVKEKSWRHLALPLPESLPDGVEVHP